MKNKSFTGKSMYCNKNLIFYQQLALLLTLHPKRKGNGLSKPAASDQNGNYNITHFALKFVKPLNREEIYIPIPTKPGEEV